jgi:MFS transporter, ACS family, tartrate transporter
MSHTAIANIIGGPLAAWLMESLDGAFGLRGWQMLFIAEGVPSILVGILVLFVMTEKPEEATWLNTNERRWIENALQTEISAQGSRAATTLRQGFTDGRVLLIMVLCFFLVLSNFGIVFWLPQVIKNFGGLSNMQVGLLTAVPYILACVAMIAWGYHSDRTGDRKWHLFIGGIVGAAGLAASAYAPNPTLAFLGLCIGAMGIWSMFGVFWATPADFLSGMAAAGGLALINSFGTLGGFVGPFVFGFVRDQTGSFTASLLTLAASGVIAGLLALALKNEWRRGATTHQIVEAAKA